MGTQSRETSDIDTITVTKGDEWYVATDEASGIVSQGKTKGAALANLAEALKLSDTPDSESEELEPSDAPWF